MNVNEALYSTNEMIKLSQQLLKNYSTCIKTKHSLEIQNELAQRTREILYLVRTLREDLIDLKAHTT
jgi:hypothetical protein